MAWHSVSDGAHAPHSDQTLGPTPTPTPGRRIPLGAYAPSLPCAPPWKSFGLGPEFFSNELFKGCGKGTFCAYMLIADGLID